MAVAAKKRRQEMPINREVLKWARERIRLSYDDAAQGVGVKASQVQEWESGRKVPTVKQARKLAHVYDRPFLEFFAKEKPTITEPTLIPDFRMHREAEPPKERFELIQIQSEAEETRLNALDLFELLGDEPPRLPERLYATLSDNVNSIATSAREIIGPSVEEQLSLKATQRDSFPNILRGKFEASGILVTKNSGLAYFGARGMCVFASPLPVIVFSNEAPSAQVFTLAHELGHIVLKQSAISGPPGSANTPSSKRIEDWCDAFAGAFLMPEYTLARFVVKSSRPMAAISDNALNQLAKAFAVSRHAMLIRLVNLGYVQASYYWDVKRPQFLEEEQSYKSGARSKYYASRYRSSRGDLYTGLVLEAWSNGIITNHNAAEFMGIKNLAHLDAIRAAMGRK
jgi:Zn-dependent peptidase ImmA (M78 family)/DNA-binding XRE family transcriptional regulator